MADKRVPALPTVSGIQDSETRKAIQSLIDGWRVRNGDSNDEGAQFVTREDLEGYLKTGHWARGRNVVSGFGDRASALAPGGVAASFRALIANIIAEIQASALWKRLSANIDRLDGPNGVLARIGLTESGLKRFTEITSNKIEDINAILIKPDGTNLAAVVDQRIAEVANGLSRTLSQTTLQTMANGGSVLAQQALEISQPSSVEGVLDASWTVKFDLDGYVVGAGLGVEGKGGNYTSQFLVRADRFAVGSPSVPDVFPFIVDTRPEGSVIALNGQVYIGAATAEEIAENASVPPINNIGAFADFPPLNQYKVNSVFKHTGLGNTFIHTGSSWALWLEKGTQGPAGTPGAIGPAGVRGSVTAYASGSAWSDTTANNAITSATGGTAKVIGDTVTISDGSSFAATRYWSGTSWVNPGVVIDGNLLVNGTLSANKINGGTFSGASIAIASSAGGWLFNAGFNGSSVTYRQLVGYNIEAGYLASPGSPAVKGSGSGDVGVHGYSVSGASSSSHGVRGNRATGEAGIVGASNGYDFYAEGGGTNYGPFTGAHDCLLAADAQVAPGDIVVDVECVARRGLSNTIFRVEPSISPAQKGAVGVLVSVRGPLPSCYPPAVFNAPTITVDDFGNAVTVMDADYQSACDAGYLYATMNALGEGQINVCGEGGYIEIGDLIVTSSIPGKGMKQADDIVRSITVAKAREAVTFASPAEVRQIACIYLCG